MNFFICLLAAVITYRGAVRENGVLPTADREVAMTFRLYPESSSAEAAWTFTTNVTVRKGGTFIVPLEGADSSGVMLDDMIIAGRANSLGIAIDGGGELYPRAAVLPLVAAESASRADSLVASPEIGDVTVTTFTADSVAASNVQLYDAKLSLASSTSVKMEAGVEHGACLQALGKVRFFAAGDPGEVAPGTVAGCNCAVLFVSTSGYAMPGMTLIFRKGETITLDGYNAGSYKCLVYPIGVE